MARRDPLYPRPPRRGCVLELADILLRVALVLLVVSGGAFWFLLLTGNVVVVR